MSFSTPLSVLCVSGKWQASWDHWIREYRIPYRQRDSNPLAASMIQYDVMPLVFAFADCEAVVAHKEEQLQDPSNKRKIICDEALRVVFETDCIDMFKMNKLLVKHIIPLDPSKDSGQVKRAKAEVETKAETETTEPMSSTSSVALSETLAKFFGTGQTEMKDEEIVRVWEYIKFNNLEDPVNPMAIHCDEKLRDLLGCASLAVVGVNEMMRRHMYKPS